MFSRSTDGWSMKTSPQVGLSLPGFGKMVHRDAQKLGRALLTLAPPQPAFDKNVR
jgi:hypothetical protein